MLGVDNRFWHGWNKHFWGWGDEERTERALDKKVPVSGDFWRSNEAAAVLNRATAEALKVAKGDTISLHVQKADNVPREILISKRRQEDVVDAIEVKVRDILPDEGMARFTLQPSAEPVRNAFVPLQFLQNRLKMHLSAGRMLFLTAGRDSTPRWPNI